MIRILLLFLSFIFLSFPLRAESLTDALSSAYVYNPVLNGARASNRVIAEGISQAYADYLPTVSLRGDYDLTDRKNVSINGSSVRDSYKSRSYSVQLVQNILNGRRTTHNVRSARSALSADGANLISSEQDTLLSAVGAYLDVVEAHDMVRLRRRNLSFLEEQTRSGRARLEVGEATLTDVLQSEAQLALAQAQLSASISSLAISRAQYNLVIGHDPDNLSWPSPLDTSSPVPLPSSLVSALELSLSNHPLLTSALHRLESSESDTRSLRGGLFPTLDLRASGSRRYDGSSSSIRNTSSQEVMFDLSIPLYQGGKALSALRGQKNIVTQHKLAVDQVRLQLHSLVISAWFRLSSARTNYTANAEQLKASKLALEGVIKERDVGRRTQLDVLDAQSAVLRAEEFVLSSRSMRVLSGYELLSSIGGLTALNLSLPVDIIEPLGSNKKLGVN